MKTTMFNPLNHISIIAFLSSFKLECDTIGIDEVAGMWLIHFVLKNQTATALGSRFTLKSQS